MRCPLLLLLLPLHLWAQKKDTVSRYLDSNLQLTSRANASYYAVSIKAGDHWRLYSVYADTTPLLDVWFKDKKLEIKDGPYKVYYPKNVPAQSGWYKDNRRNGVWKTWYTGGLLKDSGLIKDDRLIDEW